MASRFAIAAACAALVAASAAAEEILVAASYDDFAHLRGLSASWQEQTGHALIWLPPVAELDGAAADVYYLPVGSMQQRIADGFTATVAVEGPHHPGRLVGDPFQTEASSDSVSYLALPQSVVLPLLWVHADHAAAAAAELDGSAGWEDLHRLAVQLDDPIADVRGFCPPGAQRHGLIVRAMIADVGGSWLAAESEEMALAEDWAPAAERYARLLAAAGPPNAADMAEDEAALMFEQGRCSIWVGEAKPPPSAGELVALPLPGAAAAAWQHLRMVAPSAAAAHPAVAQSFALWAALGRDPSVDAVAEARLAAAAGSGIAALRATLGQSGSTAAASGLGAAGLRELDELAAPGLRLVILGLQPAAEALADAEQPEGG